jgi:hypothetical protein
LIYQILNWYFINERIDPIYSGGVQISNWNNINNNFYEVINELCAFLLCFYNSHTNSKKIKCISGQKGRRFLILKNKIGKNIIFSGFLSATTEKMIADSYQNNEGVYIDIDIDINSIPVIYNDIQQQFIFPPGVEFKVENYNENTKTYKLEFLRWNKNFFLILIRALSYFSNVFFNKIINVDDVKITDEINDIMKINLDENEDEDFIEKILIMKREYLYYAISRPYEYKLNFLAQQIDKYGRDNLLQNVYEEDDDIIYVLDSIDGYDYNDIYDYTPEDYYNFYMNLDRKC